MDVWVGCVHAAVAGFYYAAQAKYSFVAGVGKIFFLWNL